MQRSELEHIIRASGDIANEVDGAIGGGFSFHELHGYYRIRC